MSWITFGAPQRRLDGSLTSSLASLRYRVLHPISAMSSGYAHRIVPIGPNASDTEREAALDADVLVFSKSFQPSNEELARQASARGSKIIFDVCDDHYRHPQHGAHYQAMTRLADAVVCNSGEMAKVAGAFARSSPSIIEDPFEGPRGAPCFRPGKRLRLLWFGHPSNLDSLAAAMADLAGYAQRRPLSLRVLTLPSPALTDWAAQLRARQAPGFEIMVEPWSLEGQWRELAACDAVVIPSLSLPQKRVKSANRMIEALWAGRVVAAQPMPAYAPFEAWTPVLPRLSEGLAALEADPSGAAAQLAQAQAYIARTYDPAVVGRRWQAAVAAVSQAGVRA